MERAMKVKELMTSPVITIGKKATIKECGDLLEKHDINGVAVVEKDLVIGLITRADIFRSILPRYPELFEDERCLKDIEYIEERIHKVHKIKVDELMGTPAITVDSETPICRAGSIMVLRKIKQVPVLHENKLVGIITLTDICRNFMERAEKE
jgi:CBS domain-containing protein